MWFRKRIKSQQWFVHIVDSHLERLCLKLLEDDWREKKRQEQHRISLSKLPSELTVKSSEHYTIICQLFSLKILGYNQPNVGWPTILYSQDSVTVIAGLCSGLRRILQSLVIGQWASTSASDLPLVSLRRVDVSRVGMCVTLDVTSASSEADRPVLRAESSVSSAPLYMTHDTHLHPGQRTSGILKKCLFMGYLYFV